MLVLSRNLEEQISLTIPPSDKPTEVLVKVVQIRPKQVRLGFEAPKSVDICRTELPPERRLHQTG